MDWWFQESTRIANVNILTNSIQECTDFKDDIINDEFSGIEEIKESWKHKRTNMTVI